MNLGATFTGIGVFYELVFKRARKCRVAVPADGRIEYGIVDEVFGDKLRGAGFYEFRNSANVMRHYLVGALQNGIGLLAP